VEAAMRTRIIIFAAILLLSSLGFSAVEVKNLNLPAEGITAMEISCGAGFLKVQGVEGLNAIEVKAEIYARGVAEKEMKKFIEDYIKLTLENKAGRAVLVSEVKERFSFFSFRDAKIDLTVNIPKKMDLSVDDGSGDTEIGNIAGNLYVDDGSGDMRVENIQGDLKIDDGSGDIDIREITGNLSIDDGSGSITVLNVGGSVTVDDGSGDIDIDGVGKDVVLKETGSGDVHFKNIKGQVINPEE
jgi:DUF4097 and DUF4098 domain-containing protein YvlB